MKLKEKLFIDFITAMKAKDEVAKSALSSVKAKIIEYGYYCGRYMKNKTDPRLSLCGKATIDPTKDTITTYSGNIPFGGKRKTLRKKNYKKTYKSHKSRKSYK